MIRILMVLLLGSSILSTICFLSAETPEQAAQKGWAKMPQAWESGVFNHGSYIQWYSIKKHPFLFVLSVVGIAVSGATLLNLDKRPD